MKYKGILFLLMLFLSLNNSFGQGIVRDFPSRVNDFIEQHPQEMIYLQTDREVYSDGDRINFKAYVRDVHNPTTMSPSSNMHLILVDIYGNTQQEKIYKINNSQSEGALDLLGGLPKGEYFLIAWTNGMESGPADKVFKKKIFISERELPEAYIKLSAGETTYLPGDIAKVYVEILNMAGKPMKKKKFSYSASFNGSSFDAKNGKTDKEGKASLDITLPDYDEVGFVIVEVAAKIVSNTMVNSVFIPTSKTPIAIDFIPEGGLFLNGFETKFGFKAYDFMGNPLDIEGEVVDKSGNKIKDISTTGLGFGTFSIIADAANQPKVRITKPAGLDIDYQLPQVQENGLYFALKDRTEGSLKFVVNTDLEDEPISLHAVAEINGNMNFEKRFTLKNTYEFSIPYDISDQHRVIKVKLLNRSGDILAYRSLFLPGQNPVYLIGEDLISSDQDELTISYLNSKDETVPANLTATIFDKTMAPRYYHPQDIMSWFLLGPNADYASFPTGYLANPGSKDLEIIDNYLLFLMDSDLDWTKIKSGKTTDEGKSKNEFRDELKNFYQINDFEKLFSQTRANMFFSKYIVEPNPDFFTYIRENKSVFENLGYLPTKLDSDEKVRRQLESGKSVMSVLMTIKPYKLVGNLIVFRGNDSFRNQGGAIIVIDGVARGTNSSILESISPLDIEKIEASANIADIQKYSGLNSTGVIEITTKKATTDQPKEINHVNLFPTILWMSSVTQNDGNKLVLKIPEQKANTKMQAVIQGVDSSGNLLIWSSK